MRQYYWVQFFGRWDFRIFAVARRWKSVIICSRCTDTGKNDYMSEIEPVPAATVVLLRQSPVGEELEVLLLQRNSRLVFKVQVLSLNIQLH